VWKKTLSFIELAKKIADAFDTKTLQRIQDIRNLDEQAQGDSFSCH